MRLDQPSVMRLPSLQGVLAVKHVPRESTNTLPTDGAERLRTFYLPTFGPDIRVTQHAYEAWGVTIYAVGVRLPEAGSCPIVWGNPVGDVGDASDDEIARAINQPSVARSLEGTFVLAGPSRDGFRLVTSPNFVRTLYRLQVGRATVFATKALAAHVVGGFAPRLNRDVVAELTLRDFVVGDRDLLVDTRVIDAATVVQMSPTESQQTSYWPLADRLADTSPTDATILREVIGSIAGRLTQLDRAQLGLTSGRDSNLVLSCLAELGQTVRTFTLAWPGHGDPVGAAASAAAVGVQHSAPVARVGEPSLERMVEASRWTEGQVSGRNLHISGYDWADQQVVWLSGSGGELARTYYYPKLRPDVRDHRDGWRSLFLDHSRNLMAAPAYASMEAHLQQAMDEAALVRSSPAAMLDVFYLTQRMAKWLGRQPYLREFAGLVPVLLSPGIVRAMFNIPEQARIRGTVFDDALALGSPNLHETAMSAVRSAFDLPSEPPLEPPRRLSVRVYGRLPARLRVYRQREAPEWKLLAPYTAQVAPRDSVVIDVLGKRLWSHYLASARTVRGEAERRQLWNALSIEAFGQFLARTPIG